MNTYLVIVHGSAYSELTVKAENMNAVIEWLKEWAKKNNVRLGRYDIYRLRGGNSAKV